jgi:hypothetical protein
MTAFSESYDRYMKASWDAFCQDVAMPTMTINYCDQLARYVTNPITKRPIEVGKATYNKLMSSGSVEVINDIRMQLTGNTRESQFQRPRYVTNPITGYPIEVGKTTYNKLIASGRPHVIRDIRRQEIRFE